MAHPLSTPKLYQLIRCQTGGDRKSEDFKVSNDTLKIDAAAKLAGLPNGSHGKAVPIGTASLPIDEAAKLFGVGRGGDRKSENIKVQNCTLKIDAAAKLFGVGRANAAAFSEGKTLQFCTVSSTRPSRTPTQET